MASNNSKYEQWSGIAKCLFWLVCFLTLSLVYWIFSDRVFGVAPPSPALPPSNEPDSSVPVTTQGVQTRGAAKPASTGITQNAGLISSHPATHTRHVITAARNAAGYDDSDDEAHKPEHNYRVPFRGGKVVYHEDNVYIEVDQYMNRFYSPACNQMVAISSERGKLCSHDIPGILNKIEGHLLKEFDCAFHRFIVLSGQFSHNAIREISIYCKVHNIAEVILQGQGDFDKRQRRQLKSFGVSQAPTPVSYYGVRRKRSCH